MLFLLKPPRLQKLLSDRTKLVETSLVNAIGVSVAHTALNLNVKAIVAATESGSTAVTISKYRPHSDIIAVTLASTLHVNLL